jgi:hypothetical protein
VADFNQWFNTEEASATLDCVKTSKYSVQEVEITRLLFQIDQLLAQLLEYLSCLNQEILQDLVIDIDAHVLLQAVFIDLCY